MWGSLLCGLVYPATVLLVLVGQLARSGASVGNSLLVAAYSVFSYFEWPFAILALSFAHAARARAKSARRVAALGLALGYLSAAMILAAALAVLAATPR